VSIEAGFGREGEARSWQTGIWNRMSETYAREVDRRFAPVVEQVIKRSGLKSGLRVLDIGAGAGSVALIAAPLVAPAGRVACTDPSGEMLDIARSRAREGGLLNLDFEECSAEAIEAPDASFDVVLASLSLMYVIDRATAARECARVLRPGGRFVYDTVNRTWKSRLLLVWLPQNVFHIAPPDTHEYARFIKPAELEKIMARHGLRNCETRGLALKQNPIAAGISFARTRKLGGFVIGDDTGMSYVGYAEKAA